MIPGLSGPIRNPNPETDLPNRFWSGVVGRASQFGTGRAAFTHGPGTLYPLDSMPFARAARYWWGVKRWKISYNITEGDLNHSYDSEWTPYDCGRELVTKNVTERNLGVFPGFGYPDPPLRTPTALERQFKKSGGMIGNLFNNGTIPDPSYISVNLLGGFDSGDPQDGSVTNFGMVKDDSKPGNVFMSFYVVNANTGSGGDNISFKESFIVPGGGTMFYEPSAIDATLDGDLKFTMYAPPDSAGFVSGTINIDTSDTTS